MTSVIPVLHESSHIRHFLCSVFEQDYPRVRLEVVLAGGLSEDGTRSLLASFETSDLRDPVVEDPARIVPTGLNVGLRQARRNVIVRADSYRETAPDHVRHCVAELRRS